MTVTNAPRPAAARYLFAVIATVIAALIALVFRHPVLALSPLLLFYAAVAVASWYGGTGPGLVSVVGGAVLTAFLLLPPLGTVRIDSPEGITRLVLFVAIGVLIACLNGALRRANERCEAEAELARKNEARVKRLAEANLIGVFFARIDGTISWGNPEFLRLVDKTPEQLSSGFVNWLDVTAPEHRHRDAKATDQLHRCGVCEPYEKDHLLRDGQRIPVLLGCAIVDPQSPEKEVVGFVLDLTIRKRAEAEIREKQERLQTMSSELMIAEERERRRIATVLHDAVVQMLALSKMKVDGLRRETNNGSHEQLNEVYELIDRSIRHTRTLTAELSPPVLYELGLAAAIRWLGDRIREERKIGFELLDDGKEKPISEETRIVLFHAVRELLMNIVKHAHATKCDVSLRRVDSQMEVVVSDNGRGFQETPRSDYSRGGFGLFNIRQRLSHLGGTIEIKSQAGAGSAIVLHAPLVEQEGKSHEHQNSHRGRSQVDAPGSAHDAGA